MEDRHPDRHPDESEHDRTENMPHPAESGDPGGFRQRPAPGATHDDEGQVVVGAEEGMQETDRSSCSRQHRDLVTHRVLSSQSSSVCVQQGISRNHRRAMRSRTFEFSDHRNHPLRPRIHIPCAARSTSSAPRLLITGTRGIGQLCPVGGRQAQIVEHRFVEQKLRSQYLRDCKDDMMVRDSL